MKAEMHMDVKSDKKKKYAKKISKKLYKFMGDEVLWQIQP